MKMMAHRLRNDRPSLESELHSDVESKSFLLENAPRGRLMDGSVRYDQTGRRLEVPSV